MLRILSPETVTVRLPKNFNPGTMHSVIRQAITEDGDARGATVNFDFLNLEFISPVGVVVLSNLIEFLKLCKCVGRLQSVFTQSSGVMYLDNSKFFERYHGRPLRSSARLDDGTFPLTLVNDVEAMGFLYQQLVPWLARQLHTREDALASVRVCIEEILQNIGHHSGIKIGCVHAQVFEKTDEIHLAISDFGSGIPFNVRKLAPEIDDARAVELACQEGFTTKSNVQNRGAGLALLLNIVTGKDRGAVSIASGRGNISAVHASGASRMTVRTKPFVYPGTLVHIVLKTSAVRDLARDIEPEDFAW